MGTKLQDDHERITVFLDELKKRFLAVQPFVKSSMCQYALIDAYVKLLREPENILKILGDEIYPFGRISKEDKILLYGAGKFGRELYDFLIRHGYQVVAWADKAIHRPGIIHLGEISQKDFDVLVIALLRASMIQEAEHELEQLGVPKMKIRKLEGKEILQGASGS